MTEPVLPIAPAASAPPANGRLREWAGIFSVYFTAQGLTQAAGLVAGLLLVNFLPVGEFALYTLATSVLTFFAFATDLGSTSSLLYFFNKAARDGEPFAPYEAAVFSLRRAAFFAGAVVASIAFPVAALGKGFGEAEVALTTVGILAAVWFQMDGGIRVLSLRLANRYGPSYRAEVTAGLVRLVLAIAMVASGWLFGWLAAATSAAAAAVLSLVARRATQNPARPQEGLKRQRRAVLRYLLPTLPGAVYYSVQGPLVIWLATTFGSTKTMAEAGALGRLGLVLSLFSSLTGVVFLPRLARITDDRLYFRRYLQFGGFFVFVGAALLAGAWALPELFLVLIGDQYAGLYRELLLVVASAGIGLFGGFVIGVNNARSWTRWAAAATASLAAVQVILALALPLGTTAGVLSFGLSSSCASLAMQLVIATLGFARPNTVTWHVKTTH